MKERLNTVISEGHHTSLRTSNYREDDRWSHQSFLREMEITTARKFTIEGVYSKINVSRALSRNNVFIMVILTGMGARYLIIKVF
jgi:hypothetical protein